MTNPKATGNGNTQVGQNLTKEVVIIDNCTFHINLHNRSDFDKLKHLLSNIKLKKHP